MVMGWIIRMRMTAVNWIMWTMTAMMMTAMVMIAMIVTTMMRTAMTAVLTGAVILMMAEIGRVYYASKRRICYAQVV